MLTYRPTYFNQPLRIGACDIPNTVHALTFDRSHSVKSNEKLQLFTDTMRDLDEMDETHETMRSLTNTMAYLNEISHCVREICRRLQSFMDTSEHHQADDMLD